MNANTPDTTNERRMTGSPRRPGGGGHGPGGMIGQPVDKPKDFKGTLSRLLKYMGPYKMSLIIVVIMTVLSNTFSIISPKILGNATTVLYNGEKDILNKVPGAHVDFDALKQILITLAILYALSAVFTYIQQRVMAIVAQGTVYDLRKDIYDKLTRLPLKYYDSHSHGDILSRVANDVDNISNTLQQSITQLISSVVTLIGIMVMMFTINVWLALITMVALPLALIITRFVASRSHQYFSAQQKHLGSLNGQVEEMYTGHKIIKAYGREKESIDTFEKINDDLYNAGWKAQFISGVLQPMVGFVNNLGYIAVSVVGGIFAIHNTLTVGDMQAFIQYSRQFSQPITQLANLLNIIQSGIASAERVFEILDETEEEPDSVNAKIIAHPQGELSFSHVDFSYDPSISLIEDVSFDVKPGQTIALVGPTGGGKTTMVNLIMRFYEIDKGCITIDQVNTHEMKRSDVRRLSGMVLQDTWLFKGTIRDNIAYGCEGAKEEQIIKAAKAAHADHFIRTLPDGYDTILNEDASNISQGQRQLLTIARAILAEPTILILDEATSSVDTRTEILIQRAMTEMMKDRTSFVIAHRLSTIRDADLILVVNNGQIIEKGTHSQLLAQDGFYADLYNSQFTTKKSLNGGNGNNGNMRTQTAPVAG